MGNTRNTGHLRNLISYDASGNIVLPSNLTVTGSLLANGGVSYATQSYVTTQISNLVNAAPGALDTLNELAAALGNDANFSTTITNSIATKLALSGGTLTGALNGTSATFSSSITATSLNLGSIYGLPKIYLYDDGTYVNGFGIYANEFRNFFDTIDTTGSRMTWGKQTRAGVFTELMRLTKDGYVGIGVNNPIDKLHIAASDSNGILLTGGTNGRKILLSSSSLNFYTTTAPAGYAMGSYILKGSDGSLLATIGGAYGSQDSVTYTFYGGAAYDDAAMYIAGKSIGIGISAPARTLHVMGQAAFDMTSTGVVIQSNGTVSEIVSYKQTGSTYADLHLRGANLGIVINGISGNVGIGITNPSTKLSLGQGVGAKILVYDNPSTGVYAGLGQDLAAGNSTDFFAHGASNLGFLTFGQLSTNKTSYTEWARFDTGGRMGIGTNSPLQSLDRTLTVNGTGIFQTTTTGNYNENLRLNRNPGNNYASIALGGAYNSTLGTAVGQWTFVATPSNLNYKFYLDYAGTELFTVTTAGQIQQNGVGILQIVPITPVKTNISYTATINAQYTIGSTSIPSTARWVLADIYLTANISDHQNFMLTRFNFGAQKTWVDTRGNNPDNEFGNITQGDVALLTYFGESDGFTSNYGLWKTSVLVPTVGRNVWINNYGNSNSNGYIYFIVRGYSL